MDMETVAIIVAAGSGHRMGSNISKQYLPLGETPILVHTLKLFENAEIIRHIVLVVPEGDRAYVRQAIVEKYDVSKVSHIIAGGKERQDSVRNGLAVVESNVDIVIIHDGVRPFVSEEHINASVCRVEQGGAITLGVPVKDTIKRVDPGGFIGETIDRKGLWITQTPQTFKREIIERAYRKAYEDGYYGTDEASLVERIGVRVRMIEGTYENIKITTTEDIEMAEFILKKRNKFL